MTRSPERRARRAVSVIVPAFGAGAGIAAALASVFAQTFTDCRRRRRRRWLAGHGRARSGDRPFRSRIQLHRPAQPRRRRRRATRRSGRPAAACSRFSTPTIAGCRIFSRTRSRGWSPIAAARWSTATRGSAATRALAGRTFMAVSPSEGEVTLVSLIRQRCNIALSTVVARRRALVAAGLFDETLRSGHDYELWLRLAWRGAPMAYHRDVLAERRVRGRGTVGGRHQGGRAVAERARSLRARPRPRHGGAHGAADPDDGARRSAGDRAGEAALPRGEFRGGAISPRRRPRSGR